MKRKDKIKFIINDLDITPLLRFLLWKNVLFSSLSLLSSRSLPPFFLLPSSDAHFHQFAYLPSTFSSSFLIYLNIPPRTFDHPTYTTTSLCTFLVTPSFYNLLPLSFVILLPFLLFQTLQLTLPHFLDFPFFPKCPPPL